jgi:hypothetical protein
MYVVQTDGHFERGLEFRGKFRQRRPHIVRAAFHRRDREAE